MLIWGTLAIAITTLFVPWAFVWEYNDEANLLLDSVANTFVLYSTLVGLVANTFVLYSTYRRVRYVWLVRRHTSRVRRVGICAIYSPIAYLLAILQLLLFVLSANILLFMAILVMVAVAVAYILFPVAQLFVGLGRLAAACRMGGVRRWVHRLGWVMVVLPSHTLLQATKASGNLMSILFSEKQVKVKAIAACWLIGVYVGFLLVAGFAELWLIIPFLPFFSVHDSAAFAITFLFCFGIYLLLLKILLTPIDLLLDIENYHIASMNDRGPYHQLVDEAVQALRGSGCTEIHIVAHSLGSVIVYDWLNRLNSTKHSPNLPLMALYTLGSPLNKFWYVDHARLRRLADLNLLAKFPACRWTNYWAFSDVVSGPSTRYKTPGAESRDKRIRWLGPVFASHVYYWTNAVVLTGIRNGIAKSEGNDSATLAGITPALAFPTAAA
jgi:hypothetical protein